MVKKDAKIVKEKPNFWLWVIFSLSLGLVFTFFVINTLLMTMTGEDILHQNTTIDRGTWGMMADVYGFLPRVGEFFQRLAIQFYDYQTTSFNGSVAWRLVDAILCFILIMSVSALSIGRGLKVKLMDTLVILVVFSSFIVSRYNEIFMMRFSYLHNYIPILLALTAAGYIAFYFKERPSNFKLPIIGALAGLFLGASTEIAPIAFLIILLGYAVYVKIRDKMTLKALLSKYPTRVALAGGIVLGLLFMLSSGSILGRGGSSYGEVYDYISLFAVFGDTFYSIAKLIQHFIFNGRYLFIALFAMALFLLAEVYLVKAKKKSNRPFVSIQLSLLAFSLLYMVATSQINVLDDLYPRFMSPVFLAVVVSFATFFTHLLELIRPKGWHFGVAIAIFFTVSLLATVDMAYGFSIANHNHREKLAKIQESTTSELCVVKQDVEEQYPSPLFKFTTISPLEEWTSDWGNAKVYGKKLIYSYSCPSSR